MTSPQPAGEGLAAPFWRALRDDHFVLARCATCGACAHPPRPICATCGSRHFDWTPSAGTGEVWSAARIHRPTLPAFDASVPYIVVVVRLDEGVFIVSQLVDRAVGDDGGTNGGEEDYASCIGRRVELVPTRRGDIVLPLFRCVGPLTK